MNGKDAQFILESYRPGTEDDSDPLFREALKVAERDPELLHWLKKNESMDREINKALKGISPPAGLKQSILDKAQTSTKKEKEHAPPHTTHPSWWQSPWTLSMAASLALMLFVAISITQPREAEADWSVARVLDSASEQLGQAAPPLNERISVNTLKERLASGDLPQPTTRTETKPNIPATEGYALLDWDGLPVERWTFSNEAGELYHLYAIDGSALNQKPSMPAPVFKQEGDIALAAWTAKNTLYVLAHQGTIETLRPMLKTTGTTPSAEPKN